jgi:hypothetical protein
MVAHKTYMDYTSRHCLKKIIKDKFKNKKQKGNNSDLCKGMLKKNVSWSVYVHVPEENS